MPALTSSSSSSASERVSGDDDEKPEDAVRDRTLGAGEASTRFNWSLRTLTVQDAVNRGAHCEAKRAKGKGKGNGRKLTIVDGVRHELKGLSIVGKDDNIHLERLERLKRWLRGKGIWDDED